VYIEFALPRDESYTFVLTMIKLNIVDWATQHKIPYTQKTIKYTHRMAFDEDRHYTFFALTWAPSPELEFKIIDKR
jgi:hypothetical protein